MKKWIESVLNNKERTAFPFITHPGIELIGESVKNAVTDGKVQYEAIKAGVDEFNLSACCTMMDLTVEAEAFGADVSIPENDNPDVIGRLLKDASDIEQLQIPRLDKGRIPAYLLASKLGAENITDRPFFSECIGPFSLAGRLYDMSDLMMSIYTEPESMSLLLSKCTTFIANYCKALKTTGSAGVIICEPAAGLLSNEDCYAFSSVFVKQVVNKVQDDSFTVVLHNCGNTGHCTEAMVASGAKALHFGNEINMIDVLNECPDDLIIMGNIDPVRVFKQSNPNKIKHITYELLQLTKKYSNFVISSGCDIPPHTPFENIRAFYEAIEEFNANY